MLFGELLYSYIPEHLRRTPAQHSYSNRLNLLL